MATDNRLVNIVMGWNESARNALVNVLQDMTRQPGISPPATSQGR